MSSVLKINHKGTKTQSKILRAFVTWWLKFQTLSQEPTNLVAAALSFLTTLRGLA
jgi:hypothetical protein